MTEPVKKVSKKKIVFIQIDEELTSIFERIKELPYKEIYLVVPKRAILLQSVVNLKILKQKLEEIEKTMAIITNDPNGMKLAHQSEITVFDHFDVRKSDEKKDKDAKDPSALLTPVNATSNAVEDSTPSRLPKKKSSIFDVIKEARGREDGFSLKTYLKERKQNRVTRETLNLYLPGGVKKFLSSLLIVSVAVFAFVAYVVLPGATLYIEPASDVITKPVNITLVETPSQPRSLKAYDIVSTVEFTFTHSSSGIESEGANASGTLTIINEQAVEQPLIKQTRFQTDEGIVFRLQNEVIVPAASGDTPGTAEAFVIADTMDANGVPAGARGNIGPSRFILPGLRDDTRSLVYAESYEDMAGGESITTSYVLEDDLIAAREKLAVQLKEKALASLRKEALSKGNQTGIDLTLLENSRTIIYGEPIINMPYELVGREMAEFDMTGNMSISGVAYDRGSLLSILKSEIVNAQTPGKQLVRIDEDSVSIDILEVDNDSKNYKFTASIQGVEEYKIDAKFDETHNLAKRIKEQIAGSTLEEAEKYVQNLPEVNKVEISIWPVWSPTIPSLAENIKIKSLSKAEAVELAN